jgi:Phytanoyl-CoA dioxygenase (PhyH)
MPDLQADGYQVLTQAVPPELLAAYAEERAAARDGLLARRRDVQRVELLTQVPDGEPAGAIDPYAIVDAARGILLAPPIVDLLTTAFAGAPPLLYAAAETPAAAPADEPGPYRDATYTALADSLDRLIAMAVALGPDDDATFTFRPGSQHLHTTPFSGRYRAYNAERDGEAALQRHREELAAGLADGPAGESITLRPGDAIVWTGDLVHEALTGPVLAAHVCSSLTTPAWFAYRRDRARHAEYADGAAWLTSQHYDLVDALQPDAEQGPPTGVEDDAELRGVEHALREHDTEERIPPPTSGGRRHGGLVDSVRGAITRRRRSR